MTDTSTEAINDGGPAFPVTAGKQVYRTGMTLRDWLAGRALPALISDAFARNAQGILPRIEFDEIAEKAFHAADAMIAARSKGGAQ